MHFELTIIPRRLYPKLQMILPFVLFILLAGDGISEFFGGDDLMNLYTYLSHPFAHWTLGVLEFWSSAWYRPLGGVIYLTLYNLVGFNPLPFKAFLFAVLALNMFLYLRTVSRISGSSQIATWALLLCSYHAAMNGLYLNFGTIYDVLGYTFYISALLVYVVWINSGQPRKIGAAALMVLMYVFGLGLKEMVVTLPAVLLAHNLLLTDRRRMERLHWFGNSGLPVVVTGIVSVVYTAGKLTGANTLAKQADYAPHFTLQQYAAITAHYLGHLFYLPQNHPGPTAAVCTMALTIMVALLLRSRLLLFAASAALIAQLPISFIAPRGAFVMYIPLAFWGIYVSGLVNAVRPLHSRPGLTCAAFVLVAAVLGMIHLRMKPEYDLDFTAQAAEYRAFSDQLDTWNVHPSPDSRFLLANDPFPRNWIGYDALFLINVRAATTRIILNREKFMTIVFPMSELAWYDYVIDYDAGWHLLKAPGKTSAGLGARMLKLTVEVPVSMVDGFGPPTQPGWRPLAGRFTFRVTSPDSGQHKLAISLSAASPVSLFFELDHHKPTDLGTLGPGATQILIPVPADGTHTISVGLSTSPGHYSSSPLIFTGAQLL